MSTKFAHHRNSHGEVVSMVRGWTVYYPAECNGRLADLAFVVTASIDRTSCTSTRRMGTPTARRCRRTWLVVASGCVPSSG